MAGYKPTLLWRAAPGRAPGGGGWAYSPPFPGRGGGTQDSALSTQDYPPAGGVLALWTSFTNRMSVTVTSCIA
jgi:hypothetical protein